MLPPSIRKTIDLHNIIYISFAAYFYLNNRKEKTEGTTKNGKSRNTGDILNTRHGMKVRKTKTLHRKLKDEQQGPQQIKSRVGTQVYEQ